MDTQTLEIPIIWPNYLEDCIECVQRLKTALEAMDGISSVEVDAERKAVHVSYDKSVLNFESISDYARTIGVTFAERFRHQTIRLSGLDCPDCASKLETAVKNLKGVAWASVNYATSELVVEFEPDITGLGAICGVVRGFGYEADESCAASGEPTRHGLWRGRRLVLTSASGVLLLLGIATSRLLDANVLSAVLLILSSATGGLYAVRAAFYSIRGRSLDMNVLMTTAAAGAIWLGEYAEAATVMFLFSLGSTLEAYAVDRSRKSIRGLIDDAPDTALVNRSGDWIRVRIEEIEVGETVLVRPGDKIAVDGTVLQGESPVNEAPVTGEYLPKVKVPGDPVYVGSINGAGSLDVRTTNRAEDNTVARIVRLVEQAQAQKAPSQRFSETFGRVYTPIVIGLAVVVAVAVPVSTGTDFREWITRSLTLLVVACPCALVISTPVAVVAAISSAARSGVLIKGGAHLETMGRVNLVAFDKTGTLTAGRLRVQDIVPFGSLAAEELLAIAAGVEYRSEHPLAAAILERAEELGVARQDSTFFEAIAGKGARAILEDGLFYVGSRRLMAELGIAVKESPKLESARDQGATVVWIADESACLGAIVMLDTIRDSAREAVLGLRKVGVRKVVLLTGDAAPVGETVARQLHLDEAHSELLPQDKLAKVKEMKQSGLHLAMVGDGINDAPALASADVGIAMGGAGNESAIGAADVVLMADDLGMLPFAFDLSRHARRVIRQNVWFALGVVVILVAGALTNRVGLATGVLGHEGSALLVIGNSMRLFAHRTRTS